MLTKSLHTITAATNVAQYIRGTHNDAKVLASAALQVLGYTVNASAASHDPTVARIVENCAKLLEAK